MQIQLNESQWAVFEALLEVPSGLTISQIVSRSGVDHPMAMATLQYGSEHDWLVISELKREELIPTEEAPEILKRGLPERRILSVMAERGTVPMRELAQLAKEREIPMNEIIKWGSLRKWVKKSGGDLSLTDAGRAALQERTEDEKALELVLGSEKVFLDDLEKEGICPEDVRPFLSGRPALVKLKPRTVRSAVITDIGREVLKGDVLILKERNVLTSEDITSGGWREIHLRAYDVTLEADQVYPAKIHPMQKIIQQTRQAFLEMGFTEIVSPQVESAFWDFDALFQPQDHPARDIQDTFYLERPHQASLPEEDVVERVKRTHENGGDTGSTGWGYSWDRGRARQVVLRTHTTATTIRALSRDPNPPRKVFCVGKVYRNESISYKHLPEFFQVDGVVVDEAASLSTLLGTLSEFYHKMGFAKVKFKPAFFPYTEPSVEVFVYMESRKSWIEMGGSGVFRPEVTRPFGCRVPVLAWGLGLDRLAMMRYGITDIRDLYWSDLDKIKEVPLCR